MSYSYIIKNKVPPCPDPDRYVLVRRKDCMFWRKKRGSVKKAVLNDSLQRNAEMLKTCASISRRIRTRLRFYLTGLETGRLHQRVWTRVMRQLKETGCAGMKYLEGLELQERFPLERLLTGYLTVTIKDGIADVRIPTGTGSIKKNSGIVTGYFFQLIMLHGNCVDEYGLMVEEETSEIYGIDDEPGECRMMMVLPENEWMVILKVSCMEGEAPAKAARNYGMKIVGVGR